jgi:hypothetical protein
LKASKNELRKKERKKERKEEKNIEKKIMRELCLEKNDAGTTIRKGRRRRRRRKGRYQLPYMRTIKKTLFLYKEK